MLFGPKEWLIWSGFAGFAGFLLIGNLMRYAALQMGMVRLLGLVAVLLVVAAAVLLVLARLSNPKAKTSDYLWAFIPVGCIAVLIALMVFLGAA